MGAVKYIIFDFDGTIADTIGWALKIYNEIAPAYHCQPIKAKDRNELDFRKSKDLFDEYGITKVKLIRLLLRIRKEMGKHIPEIRLVKGMKDTFQQIKNTGLGLGILTSNSKKNVMMFLENNDLSDKIDFIYSGKKLFGKDKLMTKMFRHENISKEEVIYVGDEIRDIEASRKAGIPVIAVSWGLSSGKILESCQPDQIACTPKDLLSCIQKIMTSHHP